VAADAIRKWTREEIILAYALYCTIPSSKVTIKNQEIINLSKAINRTPASVKLKLQNFKAYDPQYTSDGRIGLSHGSKLDAEISAEFMQNWDALVVEVNNIKQRLHVPTDVAEQETSRGFIGYDQFQTRKIRVGQTFFRKALLSAYNNCCCITGLAIPNLLKASHIKPWAVCNDVNEKANPTNGLLLNALFDAAFDAGYISVSQAYTVMVSNEITDCPDEYTKAVFSNYKGRLISLPTRFLPDKMYIEYHNDVIYLG
jgi:putative restriction endonuclease